MLKRHIPILLIIIAIILVITLFACVPESNSEVRENQNYNVYNNIESFAQPNPLGQDIQSAIQLLNYYREVAGLNPVEYDPSLDFGLEEHINYILFNNVFTHIEDPKKEGYTEIGAIAGEQSLLASNVNNLSQAIELWMNSLYHRIPLLSPGLKRVGGVFKEGYAAFNVFGGVKDNQTFQEPILFPAAQQQQVIPMFAWEEVPNPLLKDIELPVGNFITLTFDEHQHLSGFHGNNIKLYDDRGNEIRILLHLPNNPDDPNHELLGNTIAILPIYPLEFQTMYTVEVNGKVNGEGFNKIWSFRTM
jgi:hypothetical protein